MYQAKLHTYRGVKDSDIFRQQVRLTLRRVWILGYAHNPDWFIESALGKTRAKLFKDGGLSIEKF